MEWVQYLVGPHHLKDKSGLGITVDYSRDYTVVNGVFFNFFLF